MADISAVKEITDKLESGMKDLFESDKYAAYLQTMSRFHRYSTRNTLLIHLQRPDATRVAGYNDWKNNFRRQVKKGEHGIRIFAPMPIVATKEMEKIDPETQRPIIGEDGEPVRERIEIRTARFKVVPVFDVSQTEGEPLPELAETLTGDVARYELFLDALRAVSLLPLSFEDLPPDTDGTCHFGDKISIRNGMSEIQTVSAVIHEITHAKLHDLQVVKDSGENPKDRRTEEVEAESISFAVCQYYGIETGANSFGYIAEWSRGRELKELNASLDTIRKAAAELIDGIDAKYRALAKERGIDLTAEARPSEPEPAPAIRGGLNNDAKLAATREQYGEKSYEYETIKQGMELSLDEYSALLGVLNAELAKRGYSTGGSEYTPQDYLNDYLDEIDYRPAESDAAKIADYIEGKNSTSQIYAKYANTVAERAAQFAVSSGTLLKTDEAEARRACDQIVYRVVSDMLLEPVSHDMLFNQYMDNPDFRGRLEDYAFIRAYLEPKNAMRESAPAPEAPPVAEAAEPQEAAAPARAKIPDYSAFVFNGLPVSTSNPAVGAAVLLAPVFGSDGNYNRNGNRIRVTVEEPAGKYLLFSRDEFEKKAIYFLTASGMIDHTRQYFQDEYNEETRKWEDHRPTEAELDEVLPLIAERFERDMADPAMWAKYQHAAVLNRLEECDGHNIPVRRLREEESKLREAEAERERQEEKRQNEAKFDARVDEIATAINGGKSISVGYDEYAFAGKNPMLDLFKLYGIDLPLRTQGWVNTGLAEITDGGYRYYKSKHKGDSTAFSGYLKKLREAIQAEPIGHKRQAGQPADVTEVKNTLEKGTLENKLFERFAEMFPDFASGKYSYMRLESDGFEPLSLEWVFGDRISVMHTYTQNGDLCYDPMMEFHFDNIGRTMSPCMFEHSIPPLYQYFDDDGVGKSVDGNGKSKAAPKLKAELNDFAEQWFDNIENQGYLPVKANLVLGEDNEIRVTFDKDGNPIMPEPEKAEKQYYLGYGFLGNGITVWNRAEETNGDYATVAHIASDRTVTIYDQDMPHEVRQKIDAVANSPDTRAFGLTPALENVPPHIDGAAAPSIAYETAKRVLPDNMTANDARLPDPTVTILQMKEYGYGGNDMIPLSEPWALQFYDSNMTVYLLYPDNTEAMALDRDDISSHDGFYGIDKGDWERSPEYAAKQAAAANAEGRREADLLYGDNQYHRENKFGIYQVRDGLGEARDFRFVPMRELEALGLPVERRNYELVYTAPFSERVEFLSDRYPVLNKIYQNFNENLPADYSARSVSVSDVIVLRYNGDISAFYVDNAGFKELDGFLGEETKRGQMKTPDNSAPTTAELEAEVKAGRSISLMDLSKAVNAERKPVPKGKPSLLARLDEAKQQVEQNRQPAAAANKKERGHE